jgi:hypothetical protein
MEVVLSDAHEGKTSEINPFFLSFVPLQGQPVRPQKSHFPSSVMHGCLGASPPQIPHFGIQSTSSRWLQSSIKGKKTRFHPKIGVHFDHG